MIGVTIAIGEGWKECGEFAARRMEEHTGIPCSVLDDWPFSRRLTHPYWAKLWLPEVFPGEDLLFFDTDLVCQRDWNPLEQLTDNDFAWVADTSKQIPTECERLGIQSKLYGNSGLMLISKYCTILKQAQRYYGMSHIGRWPEQSAINLAIQFGGSYKIRLLGNRLNRIVRKHQIPHAHKYAHDVNLHFVGLRGDTNLLKHIQEMSCGWNR